jgi:hypothetical protein
MLRITSWLRGTIAGLFAVASASPAIAAEKVTVAVFPSVSALPF